MASFLLRNNIRMIVSDMAGTTINESGIIYNAIKNTIYKLGYPVTENDKHSWFGLDKHEAIKNHLKKHNEKVDKHTLKCAHKILIKQLENEYFESDKVSLIDRDLRKFINYIRYKNILMTLNTGYPIKIQEGIINKLNIDLFIDDYISSEEVSKGRPAPDMIYELMKRNGIHDPKHVAKIGDTKNDMKEGVNAGCGVVIGVLTGAGSRQELQEGGADLIIDSITDLY